MRITWFTLLDIANIDKTNILMLNLTISVRLIVINHTKSVQIKPCKNEGINLFTNLLEFQFQFIFEMNR